MGVDTETQAEYWSGPAGQKWVTDQAVMDQVLAPVLKRLLEHAALAPGDQVLDVGCGTGQSTIEISDIIGSSGHVTSVDIAQPMLDLAATRTEGRGNVSLICADAETYAFAPASFSHIVSRFGVMFFEDTDAALRNLRNALRPGGHVVFACWGPPDHNPWFTLPARVATDMLGETDRPDPTAPGPMRFGDAPAFLARMKAAGFSQTAVATETVYLTPDGGVAGTARIGRRIGAGSRILSLKGATETQGDALEEALKSAFAIFDTPDGVQVPAQIHFFVARAPAS